MNTVDGTLFDGLSADDIDVVRAKFQKQTPWLCTRQMLTDYTLLQILAVGDKRGFAYLSLLSDDYSRHRVKTLLNEHREYVY